MMSRTQSASIPTCSGARRQRARESSACRSRVREEGGRAGPRRPPTARGRVPQSSTGIVGWRRRRARQGPDGRRRPRLPRGAPVSLFVGHLGACTRGRPKRRQPRKGEGRAGDRRHPGHHRPRSRRDVGAPASPALPHCGGAVLGRLRAGAAEVECVTPPTWRWHGRSESPSPTRTSRSSTERASR